MKRLLTIIPLIPLLFSCAHKGLDRTLKDQSLDGLRHESLTRYTGQDLEKLNGTARNIAMCHKKRYDEALALFKETLDKNRKNPVYWNHLGTCYYLKGEYPKSLIYLEISLGVAKDKKLLGAIHNNIGLTHLKQGNFVEAKDSFNQAAQSDNQSMTPRYNLAQLYLSKGLYDKAESILSALSAKNGRDIDINYSLAHLNLMKNKYSKALRYFKRIPNAQLKRDDVALNLATTYYFMGQEDLALKVLDGAPMKVARFALQQNELKKRIEKDLEKN